MIADRDRLSYLVETFPETPHLQEEAWVHIMIADYGDHHSHLVVTLPEGGWAHSLYIYLDAAYAIERADQSNFRVLPVL